MQGYLLFLKSIAFNVQFSSVAQLCLTICDPMNRGTPGLPVHHQLPEFTQTHVHRVSDAIQPSHPLSSSSPPAPIPPSIRVFSNESTLHLVSPKKIFSVISTLVFEQISGYSDLDNLTHKINHHRGNREYEESSPKF